MEFKSQKKIEDFKEGVIHSTLLVCAILAIIIVLIMPPRFDWSIDGVDYMSDVLVAIICLVSYVFRKRLPLPTKSIIFFILIYKLVITDALAFGIYSEDKVFLVILPFYSFLVYSLRKTLIIYLIGITGFMVIGYLYMAGILEARADTVERV